MNDHPQDAGGGPGSDRPPVDAPGALRIARNVVAGLARGAITLPLALITTALILYWHGPAVLGVWAMLSVFTNPLLFCDFGISWALTLLVARHRADQDRFRGLVSTSLALYLALAAVLVAGYLVVRHDGALWLSTRSSVPVADTVACLDLAVLTYVILLIGLVPYATLNGLEAVHSTQAATALNQVILTALIVALAPWTRSPTSLFVAAAAAAAWQVVYQTRVLAATLGFWPATPGAVRVLHGRTLLGQGLALSLLETYRLGFHFLDKWILGAFLGTGPVGYYELGVRVGMLFRGVLNALCLPLLSASATAATSDLAQAKLRRLSHYAMRYLTLVAVPATLLVLLEAPRILVIWTGRADPPAIAAVTHLVPSYLCNAFAWAVLYILLGGGKTGVACACALGAASLNLAVDLAALHLWGRFEPVLAMSLGASLLTALLLVLYQVRLRLLTVGPLVPSGARIAAAGLASTLALLALPGCFGVPTRAQAAAELTVHVALFGLVNVLVLWKLGEVDDQDRFFLSRIGL
ncbi:MAG: hypothetical protein HY815_24585 [Candidatus Riflebacteria bacterium]|nr:hypothetical protein [Candidatus Riflebacteria bacterium]